MDTHRQKATSIKTLKEILGSLKITEEYLLDRNKTMELVSEDMLIASVLELHNKIV